MSFDIELVFPQVFSEMVTQRLGPYIRENLHPHDKIIAELEIMEEPLPHEFVIPQAVKDKDSLKFIRYDMDGYYNSAEKHLKLKVLNNIYSFDTALRVLFSYLLVENGGFLIHSSSIAIDNKGILFIGVSGSGKTTIAHLDKKATVFSDEISSIARKNGRFHLYGNTFFSDLGELGSDTHAELSQVFFLNKAPYNRIGPIDKSLAISGIIRNIMTFQKDPATSKKVLDNAASLLKQTPVHNIYFLPEPGIFQTIKEHLCIK